MGLVTVRVDRQCTLIVAPGAGQILLLAQHVGQIDAGHFIAWMMLYRLLIGGARGGTKSARERQRPEFIEGKNIRRVAAQNLQIRLLRCLVMACRGERQSVQQCIGVGCIEVGAHLLQS